MRVVEEVVVGRGARVVEEAEVGAGGSGGGAASPPARVCVREVVVVVVVMKVSIYLNSNTYCYSPLLPAVTAFSSSW